LKVLGLSVASIGLAIPEKAKYEEKRKEIREIGIYKKLVIHDNVIVGAIWMGTQENVNKIERLIFNKTNIKKWKDSLLEEEFDWAVL
jgi:NAD(P)H-nitrite reductase large subunit